jgi:putative tryptophan/tyrosine transport system substrate-binding protein
MMRRREFVMLLGGMAAAAWPVAASAQRSAIPVIGFLNLVSADAYSDRLRAFRQGLKETGYVEGENLAIEYRWAENQPDRLPALATELVHRRVAVIVAAGGPAPAFAAKAATTTIPIIFSTAEDPVRLGLVTSFARPDGNLTGFNNLLGELVAKRLELLRELVPAAVRVVVFVNPADPASAGTSLNEVEATARAMGLQIRVVNASTGREIDAAFARFIPERPDALFVSGQPFFTSRRVQLALLAANHSIPAIYGVRENADAGGLMSYGPNLLEGWRRIGIYTGRILKGAKAADLPVEQSTKFELVINAQAARVLGLNVPPTLLARADEVIE